VTRPIDRLLRATVRLGSGDLEQPIERERDDEIGRLAEGFEAMRSSLSVAQRELVRAERLSAVGRAASGIVHDFKQPVTVIQARMDLLEDSRGDPEAQEEDLAAIRSEIERLTTMMQDILDFARGADDINMESGSVGRLLDEVARRYSPQLDAQDITLVTDQGYKGDWVLDFRRTGRVIENLVHNSAAAIGAGGHICVRSEAHAGVLRIEVADDGPGIPESLRENLFEPFVTMGKKHGTGLGLAMARSFTERQGGTIRYTTSGAGTTFILEFPAPDDRDSEPRGHT
jgi:signal transduction histidine kinase